jgi:Domain of unknown function (DUF4124)
MRRKVRIVREALKPFVATVAVALLAIASMPAISLAQELYKHVDENGTVTYTDRPQSADEQARDIGVPNVASPELRRQIDADLRRESSEESARQRLQEESINSAVEIERRLEDERGSYTFTIQSILDAQPQDPPQPSQDTAQEQPVEVVVPEPAQAPDARRGDRRERNPAYRGRETQEHREREPR